MAVQRLATPQNAMARAYNNAQLNDQLPAVSRQAQAKTECQRRIFAAIDANAQINLASAAAAGQFTTPQMATYIDGLAWVSAMRAAWPALAADGQADITADASWPALPADVAALVALF